MAPAAGLRLHQSHDGIDRVPQSGRARETHLGVDIEGVWHAFGAQQALADVSLTVARGEVVCLLGPSGCGKTTLLRLAAGIERLQTGRIAIAGKEVATPGRALPPEARDVGMVFQDYALFPHLTVLDNVTFGLSRLPRAERRARALDLLQRVELQQRAESYPHVLSGGEQQRVALARALAPRPAAMLLDEPFAGLDTRLRQRVREDTLRLLHQSGAAVLLVTHDPEEAMAMADRLAVMRRGRLEQVDAPGTVYARPTSPFVARFAGETNRFLGTVAGGAVATPLGAAPAPAFPAGTAVEVHLRPEAIRVEALPAGGVAGAAVALVGDVRPTGPLTVLTLRLAGSDSAPDGTPDGPPSGGPSAIRALHLGPCALVPGQLVRLTFDPQAALVYPVDGSADGP